MGNTGRFVWYELMTSDPAGAKAFYQAVVGWTVQDWEKKQDGMPEYAMWVAGERPVGGVMLLAEEAKAMGAPTHWLAHVAVEDVDATLARAKELGGGVVFGPEDIPEVGRFAILRDPQGAVISAFKPADPASDAPSGKGTIGWNELNTTDAVAAQKFHVALLGFEPTESMDMGPEFGSYLMWKSGGVSKGGISSMAKAQGFPPSWLYYITVDDLDAALQITKARGGQVLNGPMDVPGGDRVAQCLDPQGGAFALHENAKS